MSDQEIIAAFHNVKLLVESRSSKDITSPFIATAIEMMSKINLPNTFQQKLDEIEKSNKNIKSKTILSLLKNCFDETIEARDQYRNGQLRSLLLHLNNDIKMSNALISGSKTISNLKSGQELIDEIGEETKNTAWVGEYLNLGVIDSEEAIVVHLDLSEWLSKSVLNPTHKEQHIMTAVDFAKATAGLLPNFGLFDYAIAISKSNPRLRIKSDLNTGDNSIRYWENYLENLQEWTNASSAFQLRIEDALQSMKTIEISS